MISLSLMKKVVIILGLITLIFIILVTPALAQTTKTVFVDGNLTVNCSIQNYSISSRNCSGSNGNAYNTVAAGISNMAAGDTLFIRGGNYTTESVWMSFNSNATTTISAYNHEAVNISKTSIRQPLFGLGNAKNIVFYGINFTGQLYKTLGPWTSMGNNVWRSAINDNNQEPTEIMFDSAQGPRVYSMAALTGTNNWYWSNNDLYVYSVGNPATTFTSPGVILADNYDSVAIGQASGTAGNLITVDDCTFSNFSHVGIKGEFKLWVKNSRFYNIGTDWNDHHIYSPGRQSEGNEMVFERNYFGYSPGAAIHLYSDPAYAIIRYNVFNGLSGSKRSFWGVLLSGSNHKVYNNTVYGYAYGVGLFRTESHDNSIKNNLFFNNNADINIDCMGSSYCPTNNTVETNYFGSVTKCSGCANYTSIGGPNLAALANSPPNINGSTSTNPFIGSIPYIDATDFNLNPTGQDFNLIVETGQNMGIGYHDGFDSQATGWPLKTINQNSYGSGWDIGAFVYNNISLPPASTDLNHDGHTDYLDFRLLTSAFGQINDTFNLWGSNLIDIFDLNKIVQLFGK
jgi:hypothetical protein